MGGSVIPVHLSGNSCWKLLVWLMWFLGTSFLCHFFFLALIMPSLLWVQTFQIDFGSKGFRSWILGLHRSSRLIHTHCLDSFNIFWICQTIIWILRVQSKIFFLNHLMGQGMVILIPGNKCGVNSFQWWHIEGRTFLKLNEAKQLCS